MKCFKDFGFLISSSYSVLLNGSALSPRRLKTCENVTLENIWKQNWNVDLKKFHNIDLKCFQDFCFLISSSYSVLLNGSVLSPQRLKTCENVTLENIWKQNWNVDLKTFWNIDVEVFGVTHFCQKSVSKLTLTIYNIAHTLPFNNNKFPTFLS